MNLVEPCRLALEQADPDVFLLAGRYTLLDHREALDTLLPECARRDVGIVVGGPFNSGVLAGGDHYEYDRVPEDIREKTEQLRTLGKRFGVDIRAAALQFCLANPVVQSVIPGTATPARPAQYVSLLEAAIPADFWQALREQGILPEDAPLPC